MVNSHQFSRKKLIYCFYALLLFLISLSHQVIRFDFQEECLEVINVKYCVYCIDKPSDIFINEPFDLEFGILAKPMLIIYKNCLADSCKQLLQFIDFNNDTSLIIENDHSIYNIIQELEGKIYYNISSFTTRQNFHKMAIFIKTYANESVTIDSKSFILNRNYNLKVSIILISFLLTIICILYVSLSLNKTYFWRLFLSFLIMLIFFFKINPLNLNVENKSLLPSENIINSIVFYYILFELKYSNKVSLLISSGLLFLSQSTKYLYITQQIIFFSMANVPIFIIISMIVSERIAFSKFELNCLIVLIVHIFIIIVYTKKQKSYYLQIDMILIFGFLSLMQVYSMDNLEFEQFNVNSNKKVDKQIIYEEQFDQILEEQLKS